MTVELITGFAGTPHISSSDAGAYNAGLVGPGDYALATGGQLKATMSNANTFALQSGDAVLNGRHVHLTGTTTATVQSGTQGQKRNDIAALRYTRDTTTNIETVQLVIIKGTATTGTPADPTHNKGLITDGAATHDMPLYRIPLNGITVGTPVPLFNVLKPMADVWDSLTQPVSADTHQVFSDLTVKASRVGSTTMLWVSGEKVHTTLNKAIIIGTLDAPFRPHLPVRTLFGVNGAAWGLLSVETDGRITIYQRYGPDSLQWVFVDISVSWC